LRARRKERDARGRNDFSRFAVRALSQNRVSELKAIILARLRQESLRMAKHRSNFIEKAETQIKDFAIMFFYLWVVFGLLAVHESFVLSQHRIDFRSHGLALINALIFAKVMLVAQDVHLGDRLNDRPLIYSVIFKSILFAIALICFHIVEHVVVGLVDRRTLSESIAEVGADKLKGTISIGIITSVALMPFFALAEISRVIGKEKILFLFFRRRNE
jgi:hypothetical protein